MGRVHFVGGSPSLFRRGAPPNRPTNIGVRLKEPQSSMDFKLVSVIVGVILGGLIGSLGYHYKTRIENKGKINIALFNLLEIWSVVGMAKVINEDEFFNKLIQRIRMSFPKEKIDSEAEENIRLSLERSMPILLGEEPTKEKHYLNNYLSAVSELAPIDPLYAYQLNKNQMIIKFLGGFDSLIGDVETTETDKMLIRNLKSFISNDACKEFENDLRVLSKKSGYLNHWKISRHINKVKGNLVNISDSIFDNYIEHVMAPVVQAHYDKLGVSNPNLA